MYKKNAAPIRADFLKETLKKSFCFFIRTSVNLNKTETTKQIELMFMDRGRISKEKHSIINEKSLFFINSLNIAAESLSILIIIKILQLEYFK